MNIKSVEVYPLLRRINHASWFIIKDPVVKNQSHVKPLLAID
jgi:hypothetical protein